MVPLALAKSLDFGLELAAAQMLVEGNRLQLSKMLKNLIDNAIKFHAGRWQGLRTCPVQPSCNRGGGVEDDGPGIANGAGAGVGALLPQPERNAAAAGWALPSCGKSFACTAGTSKSCTRAAAVACASRSVLQHASSTACAAG